MICPKCGFQVNDSNKFCPECGKKILKNQPVAEAVKQNNLASSNKNKTAKIIVPVIAGIFIIVAAVGTVFVLKDKNNSELKNNYVEEETKKEDETALIYEENSKIYYKENYEDNAYELVTDKNGVTVVDENGNLLWKVTDSQGNEGTHPVSYPAFLIEDGNYMSCQQFTIMLPKGWESAGNLNFRFKDYDTGRSIEYYFNDKADQNFVTIEENIAMFEEAFKPMVEYGMATVTKSTTQVAGRNATKLVVENLSENPTYMETYYIETSNGTMVFTCFRNPADTGFDFKAILDTIEYKVS